MLSQIPLGASHDEFSATIVQLKAQREEEIAVRLSGEHHAIGSSSLPSPLSAEAASATLSGSHRAKITRGGKVFYMPRRGSAADRERDQQLLSQIPLGASPDEVSAAIVQLKAEREEEIAVRLSGEHHASGSPSLPSPLPTEAVSATFFGFTSRKDY